MKRLLRRATDKNLPVVTRRVSEECRSNSSLTRRVGILLSVARLTAIFLGTACTCFAAQRPNILIILCDDLGYADVGFNGSKDIPTPNLDALAKAGLICSSVYATHPVCGPSRAALLTGRSPHTLGGQFNFPYFNHLAY